MNTTYRIFAAALLAAVGAHRWVTTHRPPQVEQYHQRIREAARFVPDRIGAWVGKDVRMPTQASSVLRPNLSISRRYVNVETAATLSLLLVHCGDAHHMVGHFPLRCYPADGWTLKAMRPREWTVGGRRITGMEYTFANGESAPVGEPSSTSSSLSLSDRHGTIVVESFLMRPGGRVLRNMDELSASIVGANGSVLGAGQVQLVFGADMPTESRDAALGELLQGYEPVLRAILDEPGL